MKKIKTMKIASTAFFVFSFCAGIFQQYNIVFVRPEELRKNISGLESDYVQIIIESFTQAATSQFIWFYLFCIVYVFLHLETFSRLEKEKT